MSRQTEFLAELRTALAAIPTDRDATKMFAEYKGNEPFRKSPEAGIESFHVEPGRAEPREQFGRAGVKHITWLVDVLLGHPPYGIESAREDAVVLDCNKVSELEMHAWTTTGIEGVFYVDNDTDRSLANWWVSAVRFHIEMWQERVT